MNKQLLTTTLLSMLVVSCAGAPNLNSIISVSSSNNTVSISSSSISSSSNLITVTFDSRGGTSVNSISLTIGTYIDFPTTTKTGYTFDGWYTSLDNGVTLDQPWNFIAFTVGRNLTLYAKWTINQYTITFETNGGTMVSTQTNNYNSVLTIPSSTKMGNTFGGWFIDVGLTQSLTLTNMPASNLTLYAKWAINQYTITFETNGGKSLEIQTYIYSAPLTIPTPTKFGYDFEGWFSDIEQTEAFTVTSMPASNLTLYAGWAISSDWTVGTFIFQTYGGMTASETNEGLLINYVNTPVNFWESSAFINSVGSDGTKTEVKVDFTGVLNTSYLFKFENVNHNSNNFAGTFVEFEIVGTGAVQTATLSLTAFTAEQRAKLDLFIVFVRTPETTGAITISRIYY
jgi:uncharacterized repeat protein (TIGR02543 family)